MDFIVTFLHPRGMQWCLWWWTCWVLNRVAMDQGTHFTAWFWSQLMGLLGVPHQLSTHITCSLMAAPSGWIRSWNSMSADILIIIRMRGFLSYHWKNLSTTAMSGLTYSRHLFTCGMVVTTQLHWRLYRGFLLELLPSAFMVYTFVSSGAAGKSTGCLQLQWR